MLQKHWRFRRDFDEIPNWIRKLPLARKTLKVSGNHDLDDFYVRGYEKQYTSNPADEQRSKEIVRAGIPK